MIACEISGRNKNLLYRNSANIYKNYLYYLLRKTCINFSNKLIRRFYQIIMTLKSIKDPSIAKEKYDFRLQIKEPVSYEKWVEFIESRPDYFTWLENTEKGKKTLSNLDQIPEPFREGVLKGHNKSQACAEFNIKKGHHEVLVDFIEKYGKVSTTFMKPVTRQHLEILLEMADHMEAYLLNNGDEVIDKQTLDNLDR